MIPCAWTRVAYEIFGLHTDDKSLIPTDSLPWAMVLKSTDSASMSGIGEFIVTACFPAHG
jgi:hypothetical protein